MDDIIEFIVEFFLEIIGAATEDKTVPAAIRKLLFGLLIGFCLGMAILLVWIGIEEGNAFCIAIGGLLIVCCVIAVVRRVKKSKK